MKSSLKDLDETLREDGRKAIKLLQTVDQYPLTSLEDLYRLSGAIQEAQSIVEKMGETAQNFAETASAEMR